MKSRFNLRAIVTAAIALCSVGTADATSIQWNGTTSTDWSDGTNWAGGTPGSTDNAEFSGTFSNQPTLTVNTANTGGVWMTGTPGQDTTISGAFTLNLTSNTINSIPNLGILVDNTNASTLTVSSTPQLQSPQTWQNSSANLLTVNGVATNAQPLTISNTSTGGTTISGSIGGSGAVTISSAGTGFTTFSSSSSPYSGKLTIASGILSVGTVNNSSANGPLGNSSGSVDLGSAGSGNGTLRHTGATVSSSKKFTMVTGGTGTFIITNSASTLTLSGVLDGGGGLIKEGPGTLTLSAGGGTNVYSGDTVINTGVLKFQGNSTPSGAGKGNVIVNSGGIFQISSLSGNSINGLFGTGTVRGNSDSTTVRTVTLGFGDASGSFSGTLVNSTTNVALAIRKFGTGTQVLSGTNTNTGAYTIGAVGTPNTDGGILQFAKRVSLYNANVASWTAPFLNVTVGTLAINVGGVDEFTSADITTLNSLTGYTATNGFANGTSFLGIDTTNASGGIFTHASAIANSNGGANAMGVKKLGANTLEFTATNTYTGLTSVLQGTLLQNGNHTGGGAYSVASGATLGGNGSISGPVSLLGGSTISPGTSPGTLAVGGLTISDNSSSVFELNVADTTVGGGINDLIDINGLLDVSGANASTVTVNVVKIGGGNFDGIGTWTLMSYDTLNPGLFNPANILITGLESGYTGTVAVVPDTANPLLAGTVQIQVVPEASSFVLSGLGLLSGLVFARNRRKTAI